jgi:fibronectin-binding autotransporter adhesin
MNKLRVICARQTLLAMAVLLLARTAGATTYYYDTSSSPGLGGTPPIGTWASATNAEWTIDPTGSVNPTTASWATGTFNDAVFDGTAAALSITSGGVFANSMTVNQNGYSFASGTLTLQNQANIIVASGKTTTFASILAGTVGYNVSGGGTLNLTTATNTNTGAVSVTGGSVLEIASSAQIGGATGDITLDNGTLRSDATAVVTFIPTTRNIILGAGGGTLNTSAAATGNILTYDGVISGTGNTLHKTGTAELRISGTQTFGNLSVDQGFKGA